MSMIIMDNAGRKWLYEVLSDAYHRGYRCQDEDGEFICVACHAAQAAPLLLAHIEALEQKLEVLEQDLAQAYAREAVLLEVLKVWLPWCYCGAPATWIQPWSDGPEWYCEQHNKEKGPEMRPNENAVKGHALLTNISLAAQVCACDGPSPQPCGPHCRYPLTDEPYEQFAKRLEER